MPEVPESLPDRAEQLARATDEIRRARRAGEDLDLAALAERFDIAVADAEKLLEAEIALEAVVAEPEHAGNRAAPPLPPPELPDDYEVLGEIGRGGMGVVYRARQRSLDRTVAVKVLRPGELVYGPVLERFRREARSLAKLRHPHIVSVHEVGDAAGNVFFSMDLIEGQTLADLVEERALTPARTVRLMRQVTSAVAYSHSHGLIHRDLKPANVLVDSDGDAYVVDFGLALEADVQTAYTRTGQLLGTPHYMSPEQARGDRKQIGERSDVYALGAILYECLTGKPPFEGESVLSLIEAVIRDEPKPPRRLDAKVPADLEVICLKALSKEPARRYATARAMLEDLERFEEGKPVRAQEPSLGYRLRRFVQRHWTPLVTGGLVAAVLLLVLLPRLGETPDTLLDMAGDFEERAEWETAAGLYDRLIAKEGWTAEALEGRSPSDDAVRAHLGCLRCRRILALQTARAGEPLRARAAYQEAWAFAERALGPRMPGDDCLEAVWDLLHLHEAVGDTKATEATHVELDKLARARGNASVDPYASPVLYDKLHRAAYAPEVRGQAIAQLLVGAGSEPWRGPTEASQGDHQVRVAAFVFEAGSSDPLLLFEQVEAIAKGQVVRVPGKVRYTVRAPPVPVPPEAYHRFHLPGASTAWPERGVAVESNREKLERLRRPFEIDGGLECWLGEVPGYGLVLARSTCAPGARGDSSDDNFQGGYPPGFLETGEYPENWPKHWRGARLVAEGQIDVEHENPYLVSAKSRWWMPVAVVVCTRLERREEAPRPWRRKEWEAALATGTAAAARVEAIGRGRLRSLAIAHSYFPLPASVPALRKLRGWSPTHRGQILFARLLAGDSEAVPCVADLLERTRRGPLGRHIDPPWWVDLPTMMARVRLTASEPAILALADAEIESQIRAHVYEENTDPWGWGNTHGELRLGGHHYPYLIHRTLRRAAREGRISMSAALEDVAPPIGEPPPPTTLFALGLLALLLVASLLAVWRSASHVRRLRAAFLVVVFGLALSASHLELGFRTVPLELLGLASVALAFFVLARSGGGRILLARHVGWACLALAVVLVLLSKEGFAWPNSLVGLGLGSIPLLAYSLFVAGAERWADVPWRRPRTTSDAPRRRRPGPRSPTRRRLGPRAVFLAGSFAWMFVFAWRYQAHVAHWDEQVQGKKITFRMFFEILQSGSPAEESVPPAWSIVLLLGLSLVLLGIAVYHRIGARLPALGKGGEKTP